MGFLYPFALFAALAAAGPILLHFWRREQQQPPNLFPGVYFLIDPAAPVPHKAKPLTWLLTLLRAALILILAVLIAGPYWRTTQAQALPEHPVLLALVIDDSPSMGLPAGPAPATRLSQQFDIANRLIDELPNGSGLVWTTTSGRFHPLTILADATVPGARASQHLTVEQIPPTAAAGDIGRALERATHAALELAYPARHVLVLSDLTAGVETPRSREVAQAVLAQLAEKRIALTLLDPHAPDASGGSPPPAPPSPAPRLKILSLDRPTLWRVGRPVTLAAQVLFDAEAPGAPPRALARLTWTLGDETVEQPNPLPVRSIDLPCGLRLQTFELARSFPQEGWWKLEVAAQIDDSRQDQYRTYLPVSAPTPVWLVEPPESANDSRYLALAIDPTRSGSGAATTGGPAATGNDWTLLRKTYADLDAALPTDGVLVLWGGGRDLPAGDWDRIATAAAQGMGVWFVPDGGPLPTHADHPWIFWTGNLGADSGQLPVTRLNRPAALSALPIRGLLSNPIRTAVQAVGPAALQAAAVERYYPLRSLEGGADTLLAVDLGNEALHPALIEKPLGRGLGLVLTTPPIAANAGLVQSELWPLIAGVALERVAPTVGDWPEAEVGRPLRASAGAGAEPPFRLQIVSADTALPAHWDFGAELTPALVALAGPEAAAGGGPADSTTISRPIGHFFQDGRFHFQGLAAQSRSVMLITDGRRRLCGVQSAQIAAREWDDTPLAAEFWQPAQVAPAGGLPAAGAAPPRCGSAAAVLTRLREIETQPGPEAEIAVTIHGDLSPWVLAALVICALPWVALERREYQVA